MPEKFAHIAGTGSFAPSTVLLSSEIDRIQEMHAGWCERATGIRARPVARDVDQIEMGVLAAREALQKAGIASSEIDLVLFGAAVPYQSIPATAPILMQALGMKSGQCAAYDVNSTCLSFLTAFDIAAGLIESGRHQTVLVVSSEIASRALPWSNAPLTAALFGDGAGAMVLTAIPSGEKAKHTLVSRFETYPEAYEICRLGAGGTRYDFHEDRRSFEENSFFEMDGKALFRFTARYFEPFLDRLLKKAGWRRDEVDLVVPHQASPTALRHLVDRCGFARENVVDIMEDHGNQIAASIPSALDHAARNGHLVNGAKVLFLGTSAGLSLGGIAYVA